MLVTDKDIDLKQALNYHQIMKFPITNRYYMQIFWLHIIMKRHPLCQLAVREPRFLVAFLFLFRDCEWLEFYADHRL